VAKKLIKRWLPTPSQIRDNGSLGIFSSWFSDPNLWHLNRRSVSTAFFVGILVAFMPTLGQMIIAAAAAIVLRCNLPVSVALVWISNPVTMPPIFYGSYKLGSLIVGTEAVHIDWSLGTEQVLHQLNQILVPLLVGCTVAGLFFATLGYFFVRLFWRLHVTFAWRARAKSRNQNNS